MGKKRTRSVADVLDRAADIIEKQGWRQFSFGLTPDGPVCAWGAINLAAGCEIPSGATQRDADSGALQLANEVKSVLEASLKRGQHRWVGAWNDTLSPKTGKRTVIRRLRKVAAALREQAAK